MTLNMSRELQKDQLREGLSRYTRRAFQMLPELDNPSILDIGCGTGVPTIELARLSTSQIIGLDVNQPHLDELRRKIEEAGLSNRVKTIKCSMLEMDFPEESFDIIWAEGSIAVIGFERGLNEWQGLLKPKGFLVVHDEITNLDEKLNLIPRCGYVLLGYFTVTEETWWHEYYSPLEERIQELRITYRADPEALAVLEREQQEIDLFKRNPKMYSSVFFVMQKSG